MLTTRNVAVLVATSLTGLVLAASPAAADNIFGDVHCGQTPSPACQIAAGTRPDRPAADSHHADPGVNDESNSTGSDFGCRHMPVNYDPPNGQPPEPGGWFMVLCSPDGKDPDSHGPVWVPAGAGTPPTLSPEQVAQMARKQLRLPAPVITASPSGTQLVHVPTWLWLSAGWTDSAATASVPGVSVTATATPVTVSWSMGDGTIVTCAGPGTRYQADADPKASSPDCGHTYRRSSAREPGQAFAVSATVQWTVTWSGAGQSGTFPDLTTTNSTTFRVAEAHALNNGTR